MTFAIRAFALSVVLAGAAAAAVSSSSAHPVASHQAVSSSLPVPICGPGVPTCPKQPIK